VTWIASHKGLVRWTGVVLVVLAGAVVASERDVFFAVLFVVAVLGLFLGRLDHLQGTADLELSFLSAGEATGSLLIVPPRLRPINASAIVEAEKQAALASVPAPPKPSGTPAAMFAAAATAGLLGPTADQRTAFLAKVERHLAAVNRYLHEYSVRRRVLAPQVEQLELQLANGGGADAENARVRLRFPGDAFAENPDDEAELPEPDEGPRWGDDSFPNLLRPSLPRVVLGPSHLRRAETPRGGLGGPTYSWAGTGEFLVEYSTGHLSIGMEDRSSHPIQLQVLQPGRYEVPWQVFASGLSEPSSGVLQLEVREPEVGGPEVTNLADLPALDS